MAGIDRVRIRLWTDGEDLTRDPLYFASLRGRGRPKRISGEGASSLSAMRLCGMTEDGRDGAHHQHGVTAGRSRESGGDKGGEEGVVKKTKQR